MRPDIPARDGAIGARAVIESGAPGGWGESAREYARGFAGGLLFSAPILYTMEMWEAGFLASPLRLLVSLAGCFSMLLLYNLFAGLHASAAPLEAWIDSIEELGLGLMSSAALLWLFGRIDTAMAPLEIAGRIVVEGLVMAIGFSIGTAQLGNAAAADPPSGPPSGLPSGSSDRSAAASAYRDAEPWRHVALAACGATLFALNVAATEEILVLAIDLSASRLSGLMLLSFGIGAVILHYSEFRGTPPFAQAGWVAAMRGTVVTYGVALLVSAMALWLFGRFDEGAVQTWAAQVVVLGFPTMLGAAAGKLLLQPR